MSDLIPLYHLLANAIIAIAIMIYIVTERSNKDRLRYVIIIAGFLAILFIIKDILISQFFIGAWLYFENAPMIIPRWVVLVFLLIALVSRLYSPVFLAIAFLLYFIIIWGFLLGAWKRVTGQVY